MKKIALISFLLLLFVFTSCTSSGGNNIDDKGAIKEGTVVHINAEMFKKMVWDYKKNPDQWKYNGKLPCIIDFYADWCRPCRMVAPIMDELAKEYKGKVMIYKVNTDQERELAQLFNIQSIPAVLFIPTTGKPQMSVGALPKTTYLQVISDVLQVK